MSKLGKIALLVSALSFILLFGTRLILGGWEHALWLPLVLGIVGLVVALVRDRQAFVHFITMKPTKHGMNMGAVIALALVGLICVNIFAVRYEKRFDWSGEKLNSLSDQSVKAAKGLKQETKLVLFYRKASQDGENIERSVRDLAEMFGRASDKIKFESYNALQRPDLAQQFGFNYGDFGVYAAQGSERTRIEPVTEESVTRALLKFGRGAKKTLYFTSGHGERALDGADEEGLSLLNDELGVIYETKPLSIIEQGNKIPVDAAAVVIARPQSQFLERELQALREYVRDGGKLLIAIDPGFRHNMALLTKSFGIEFTNAFVLDPRVEIPGAGVAGVLGTEFSGESEITRAFSGQYAIFLMASSFKKPHEMVEGLTTLELVKSAPQAASVPDFKDGLELEANGPHILAMSAKGANGFEVIAFADSDFFSNRLFGNNLNKDLILNSLAELSADKDLISIRPKQPKGTLINLGRQTGMIWVLGFLVPLPILLFSTGGFFWWRRRRA
ncbi:MAG TPA: GldG family protein [Bdellovibrionales bacterium]|nr:GldG family protein [Bdellovibrionales bacterium]